VRFAVGAFQEQTMPKNLRLTGNRVECPTCRECFNSDSAFDRHRVGTYDDPKNPRRCLTVPQMVAKGFKVNAQGFWIRGKLPAGTVQRKRGMTPPAATVIADAHAVEL